MGFGIHNGWAVEGAIGSSFKIDASYLSPNVNMASRLEAATKQFGVFILFSGQLYDMFITHKLIDMCRHIGNTQLISIIYFYLYICYWLTLIFFQ